jgi:hypothetical protein
MKLTKQIINISNKQIATKIMGSESDRKKFNYKNDKRKTKQFLQLLESIFYAK